MKNIPYTQVARVLREADIEGLIAAGQPADVYEEQARAIHAALIEPWIPADMLAQKMESIWAKAYTLDDAKKGAIRALAARMLRR